MKFRFRADSGLHRGQWIMQGTKTMGMGRRMGRRMVWMVAVRLRRPLRRGGQGGRVGLISPSQLIPINIQPLPLAPSIAPNTLNTERPLVTIPPLALPVIAQWFPTLLPTLFIVVSLVTLSLLAIGLQSQPLPIPASLIHHLHHLHHQLEEVEEEEALLHKRRDCFLNKLVLQWRHQGRINM